MQSNPRAAEALLLGLLQQTLLAVSATVTSAVQRGAGADVLGAVPGRPAAEDLQIGIDDLCEQHYRAMRDHCERAVLSVRLQSEHGAWGPSQPDYYLLVDPFDGSGLFRRGIRRDWWSVAGVVDAAGRAVAGGAIDLLAEEIFLAGHDGVARLSLRFGSSERARPSARQALDGEAVLAGYLMHWGYARPWLDLTAKLAESYPASFVWPNGGSCIYPWLAAGLVDAYVMPDEPRSEIDPGLAFAQIAGISLYVMEKDGLLTPYRFEPEKQAEGRVPLFIAACTEGLARDLARHIAGAP